MVTLERRETAAGVAPCLLVEAEREELRRIPFAAVAVQGAEEIEVARSSPGEFPGGLFIPLSRSQEAVRVCAVTGYGAGPHAPNSLAAEIFDRGGTRPDRAVRLADPAVDYGAARRVPSAPGWRRIALEIENADGPVIIGSARLRLDGDSHGEDDQAMPSLPAPLLLPRGGRATIDAWLSEPEFEALASHSRPRTGTIDLALPGDQPARLTVSDRARLFRAQEASFTVELAALVRGRAGQRGRVGALVSNTGGSRLRVTGIEFVVGDEALDVDLPLEWRDPIDPGDEAPAELRPLFPAAPGRRNVTLRVTAIADNEEEPLERQARGSGEVTPKDSWFDGWICIDFGTSESGAAATPGGKGRPIVIDLGRVPLQHEPAQQRLRDRLGRFLPTVVAEMADGRFLTGLDASALVRAYELFEQGHPWPDSLELPKRMAAEFKWELDDGQRDGGERGQRLAAAYLKTVKELIENHPRVAAAIGPETRVFATRPTVFEEGRAERLIQSFVDAGLGNPQVALVSGERSLIAESWSPLPFVLQDSSRTVVEIRRAMLPLEEDVGVVPIPGPWEGDRAGASAWLLVCDVGAGSADFSVVEIFPEGTKVRQILSERDSYTDTEFVGRRFRELIERELLRWSAARWREQGNSIQDERRFADAVGAGTSASTSARVAFRHAIESLQYQPGILSGGGFPNDLQTALSDAITASDPNEAMSTIRNGNAKWVEELVYRHFGEGGGARKAARAYLPLELAAPGGATIVIDTTDLPDLVLRLTRAFLKTHFERMVQIIDGLTSRSGLQQYLDGRPQSAKTAIFVRIVPSGRGGAFPLARAMVRAVMGRLSEMGATLAVLGPVASKSITSWGALMLAANLENPTASFRIDLGGRPLRPSVMLGSNVDGDPMVMGFEAAADGAFVDLAAVSERHVDFSTLRPLTVFTSFETDLRSIEVAVPPEAAQDPKGWWLCAFRRAARVYAGVVRAASGEEALDLLHAEEGT